MIVKRVDTNHLFTKRHVTGTVLLILLLISILYATHILLTPKIKIK